MKTDRLSVRLSDEIQQQIDALVEATGMTESEIVREALADYCHKRHAEPTCFDVAKRSGFLGCVDGGPDDLSVNPKYMEGFGSG